jgi:twitching motility protein PilT
MAATGPSSIPAGFEGAPGSGTVETGALLSAMLKAHEQISDLIFSPGRPPQVEVHGQLFAVQSPALGLLTADDTRRIAADLIGSNKQAITILREQGSCDISYGLPGLARFRANVFIQRGSCAVVMRVIATSVPTFQSLGLPPQLKAVANIRDGIVLVTGPRGSGKSSTLAALLDQVNEQQTCHVITIEDPIEFLHTHKRATIHQRELHSDTPNAALALRAALRQAPKVILVGEMHDRETMELVLEAAETGHLVLSGLNAADAAKAVERIVSSFTIPEQPNIRGRLAKTFRYIVSQRLIPRQDGGGRVAAIEILKSNARTRECVENGERSSENLLELMKQGVVEGMQTFDGEIERLVRAGVIDLAAALSQARNPQELQKALKIVPGPGSE